MRILLLNPPHPSIGSRVPHEHLPPLGLFSIGGPLIDAGHEVRLLDAELGTLSIAQIAGFAACYAPDAILTGHSGSTSDHSVVAEITRLIRRALPKVWIIYGGVFPTYHWREILTAEPQISFIVRGEGEETALRLVQALEAGEFFPDIPGIAYWYYGRPFATLPAQPLKDMDASMIRWESMVSDSKI